MRCRKCKNPLVPATTRAQEMGIMWQTITQQSDTNCRNHCGRHGHMDGEAFYHEPIEPFFDMVMEAQDET